jgi:short subunit dehydrogenase-like uncharacterized protein
MHRHASNASLALGANEGRARANLERLALGTVVDRARDEENRLMRDAPWILYGANGVTGRLVLTEALRRGHQPIVAGRDSSIHALGEAHRLESVCVSLDDAEGLRALLEKGSRVLHTAGPYAVTAEPMRDACVATHTPYLDIDGEIDSLVTAVERDAEAKAARVPLIVGAGFGVTAAETVAMHVARQSRGARRLLLGVRDVNGYKSAGAAMSTLDVLGHGGAWIEHGSLRRGAMAHTSFRAIVDKARYTFVAAPRGEAFAAHRSTGIPEVIVGVPVPAFLAPILRLAAPLIHRLLRQPRVRRFMERRARNRGASSTKPRSDTSSFVWAQASGDHGTSTAVLSLGEGYAFAAAAIVRASELLSSFDGVGTWTPGAAFGPDFVMELDGVRREDVADVS